MVGVVVVVVVVATTITNRVSIACTTCIVIRRSIGSTIQESIVITGAVSKGRAATRGGNVLPLLWVALAVALGVVVVVVVVVVSIGPPGKNSIGSLGVVDIVVAVWPPGNSCIVARGIVVIVVVVSIAKSRNISIARTKRQHTTVLGGEETSIVVGKRSWLARISLLHLHRWVPKSKRGWHWSHCLQ